MDHQQAFLKAIRRQPGLYATRLIFADWLEEKGDPRGEFMRLQVQALGLPKDSPARLDREAHAHDLLLVHEADWLGPLLGAVANWEWRGGMIDWVTVAADVFLAHAERWLPALPLLGVHLRKVRPHVAALARCKQLAYLSGLYLGDNDLGDDGLRVLLGSRHLKFVRSLYLQSNGLGVDGARVLAETPNLPRLRLLCLGNNPLRDNGATMLARAPRLGRLRDLNLSIAFLDEEGVHTLAGSPLLARLHVLGLGLNQLPAGCLKALAEASGFARVRALGYELNQPSDADVAGLAGSPHASGLRHLSLESTRNLGDRALTALSGSPYLGQLRTLSLGSGSWGPASVRALGRSRTLTSLRSLELTEGPDTSRRIPQVLLGAPLIRRLRRLALNFNRIGKGGVAALASHSRPLRLRQLYLPLSRASATAWETLAAKRLLTRLTALTLSDPPRGALRSILEAGRFPELRRLTLHGLPNLDEFQELLDSPLLGRLHDLRINLSYATEDTQGSEVVRRLTAVWQTPALRRLELMWSMSADAVRLLAAAPPPPALTELTLGSFRMGKEGMAALADWPLLGQLRRLVLSNSSAQAVPGLEALADSPHVGPLLRVDIHNGHVPNEVVPVLRRRFGGRFGVSGRMLPRTILLGGWHRLVGDGED